MDPGRLWAEGMIVRPLVWDKWCKEPCTLSEPTQENRDFWSGVALVICYSKFHDPLENKLQDQMAVSLTLVYVPEHWQLPSFQESSYVINTAREHGDPQGMISLTRVQNKAPFLPDISYWEYGLHMTITPLTPLDEEGLTLCSPPQDFAVSAFHCKSWGSRKGKKLTSQAPLAFWKALPGELLTLTRCNGKTWAGTCLAPDQHEVQMAPVDTFVKLHATNGIPVLSEYAFALCSPDGSDSEIPEDTNKDTQPKGELQPPAGLTRIESGLDQPGVPAPTPSAPTPQPTKASGVGDDASTNLAEEGDAGTRPTTPAAKPAKPSTSDKAKPQPAVMPTVSRVDTMSPSPVPAGPSAPPGLAAWGKIPNSKDLDLWTSALQPLFNTDIVSEADMEAQQAHARETGQVVSDQILGWS